MAPPLIGTIGAIVGAKLTEKFIERISGKVWDNVTDELARQAVDRAVGAYNGIRGAVSTGFRKLTGGAEPREEAAEAAARPRLSSRESLGNAIREEMEREGVVMVSKAELDALRAVADAAEARAYGIDGADSKLGEAMIALRAVYTEAARRATGGDQ